MKYFTVAGEDRRLDDATRRQLRGSYLKLSDGVTHYELRGPTDGPVAVLVPGLTIPLFYWDSFADQLHARGIQTLAFSAFGRGYSDRIATTYNEELFRRQLHELIEGLPLPQRVHLVGTSMGALIALGFVVAHTDRVASLSLAGPAGLDRGTDRRQRLLHNDFVAKVAAQRFGRRILLGHLGHNVSDPALVGPLTAMIGDTYRYAGSMFGFFSTLQNFPLSGRMALFRAAGTRSVPTMLMWGNDDRVTPISGWDSAAATLHPLRTHVYECGHMAPYERPIEVADDFVAFLAAHNDRSSQ